MSLSNKSLIITSPWPKVDLPLSSVYDLVWSNPHNEPDGSVAIVDGLTGRSYTRGQLKADCQKLSYGFRHTLGLQQGAVICVFATNSIEYYLMVLGAQCGGYVLSGANAAYTQEELKHQVGDSATELILCAPELMKVALEATSKLGWSEERQSKDIVLAVRGDKTLAGGRFKTLDDFIHKDKLLEPCKIKDPKSTVAFLGYSSGTSGASKGVRTSHYNMTSVLSMLQPLDIVPSDVHMAVLPLNHIYGLTKVLHYPLYLGSLVVILPRFELKPFCSLIQKYKVTICMLVPPIALLLARDPVVSDYNLSSLKLVISGAAPLGRELEKELATRLKTSVVQAYGLTEASPTTHYCPIAANKSGSIGPLLPMMRGRIIDPVTGADLPRGKEGEMVLQGPNVMLGYLNRDEADAETLVTDANGKWLKTGDVAYVDEDGFYYITDRLKELIKYKGFQVAPAELEATLLTCPLVADVAVIGVWTEEEASELPRGYVVLSAEGKKFSPEEAGKNISSWLDSRVARHKRLRGGVRILETIPKSPSGKLLRRLLRDHAKSEEERKNKNKTKAKL